MHDHRGSNSGVKNGLREIRKWYKRFIDPFRSRLSNPKFHISSTTVSNLWNHAYFVPRIIDGRSIAEHLKTFITQVRHNLDTHWQKSHFCHLSHPHIQFHIYVSLPLSHSTTPRLNTPSNSPKNDHVYVSNIPFDSPHLPDSNYTTIIPQIPRPQDLISPQTPFLFDY